MMIIEVMILVCLMVVIALLLEDKVTLLKGRRQQESVSVTRKTLPDIMGVPRVASRQDPPNYTFHSQPDFSTTESLTFDEDSNTDYFGGVVPQEELDEIFGPEVDLDEEEAEWRVHGAKDGQDGFATGVTFEELSILGSVLRQESPDPANEQQAAGIAYHIQGTDLLDLMMDSIENASERIAGMLDKHLAPETDSGSSTMRNTNNSTFDINNFI